MENQQHEALLAADALESIGRALGDSPTSARQVAIRELRRLHARCAGAGSHARRSRSRRRFCAVGALVPGRHFHVVFSDDEGALEYHQKMAEKHRNELHAKRPRKEFSNG